MEFFFWVASLAKRKRERSLQSDWKRKAEQKKKTEWDRLIAREDRNGLLILITTSKPSSEASFYYLCRQYRKRAKRAKRSERSERSVGEQTIQKILFRSKQSTFKQINYS